LALAYRRGSLSDDFIVLFLAGTGGMYALRSSNDFYCGRTCCKLCLRFPEQVIQHKQNNFEETPMKLTVLLATAILLFSLAGCSKAKTATAEIHDAQGNMVGTATLTEVPDGVKISLDASNLPPGLHGIHVHSVGKCEPPDFATAAAHFNPDAKHHGAKNPQGPHAGDLPNITVGSDGKIKTDLVLHNVTLGDDPEKSLLRQGGTALVIHAAADDETTDPSGNSGARIACGVIKAK